MNKDPNVKCALCESTNVELTRSTRIVLVPYGGRAEIPQVTVKCRECGNELDATDEDAVETTLATVKKNSVGKMLDCLAEQGLNFAGVERALELPQRTLSRWKSTGDASAAGLALLRIVRTIPWIVDVADSGYSEGSVKQHAFRVVSGMLRQEMDQGRFAVAGCTSDSETGIVEITVQVKMGNGESEALPGSTRLAADTRTREEGVLNATYTLSGV